MTVSAPSRRRFLKTAAAAGAVSVAAPYVKSARSAGSLSVGLWDHWVPGANDVMREVCEEWGAANGVEIGIDFITSIGNKLLLTAQAESRARTGHDIYCVPGWFPSIFRDTLEPVDDVVREIEARTANLCPAWTISGASTDGGWRARRRTDRRTTHRSRGWTTSRTMPGWTFRRCSRRMTTATRRW